MILRLFRRNISPSLPRFMKACSYSSDSAVVPVFCERLERRQLLRVGGEDASKFLQGLITNDIEHLDHGTDTGTRALYCMFLNAQGRVLFDTILYRNASMESGKPHYLMECDRIQALELIKHLTRYKLRRKVDVTDISKEYDLWVVFQDPQNFSIHESSIKIHQEQDAEAVANIGCFDFKANEGLWTCRDPRLTALGWRVISPSGTIPNEFKNLKHVDSNLGLYMALRFKLGVGEGVMDLPPGGCFALESNADYLHGVSFTKGCYIGQELTARTHHTGVVRRRLMPLVFESQDINLESKTVSIVNPTGQKVGKFRHNVGNFGLGSLKIAESLSADVLNVKESENVVAKAITFKPFWWPIEITKDRLITKK